MSKTHENITTEISKWICQQRMFFVATAPLASSGHINVSPKGGDSFRIPGPLEVVVYEDFTGSGVETAAHLRENGRIVIMFRAFQGPLRIARLHAAQWRRPAIRGTRNFLGYFPPIRALAGSFISG